MAIRWDTAGQAQSSIDSAYKEKLLEALPEKLQSFLRWAPVKTVRRVQASRIASAAGLCVCVLSLSHIRVCVCILTLGIFVCVCVC